MTKTWNLYQFFPVFCSLVQILFGFSQIFRNCAVARLQSLETLLCLSDSFSRGSRGSTVHIHQFGCPQVCPSGKCSPTSHPKLWIKNHFSIQKVANYLQPLTYNVSFNWMFKNFFLYFFLHLGVLYFFFFLNVWPNL